MGVPTQSTCFSDDACGGGGAVPATIIDAAGDLIVGTGDNTVDRMATTAFGLARLADADAAAARAALGVEAVGVLFAARFGAVGDGVTDDTDAIQTALDAALAAGGRTVLLDAGTFLIRRPLVLGSRVTLAGAGMGVTTITRPAGVRSLLTVNASPGNTSVTVAAASGFAVGGSIHLSDTSNWEWASTQGRITDVTGNVVTFTNSEGLGRTGCEANYHTAWSATAYSVFPLIRNVEGSLYVTVRDLTLDGNAGANDPNPTSATVNGVADFTVACIHWVETYYSLVDRVEILDAPGDAYSDQAQDGSGLTPSRAAIKATRNTIRGCRIHGATRHGIHVGTCGAGAIVEHNTITNCAWDGSFYCASATDGTATGNVISGCGRGFAGGDDRDTGNTIAGNVITGCTSWAIEFSGGGVGTHVSSLTITGNHIDCSGAGAAGLLIGVLGAVVTGNTIVSTGGTTEFCQVTSTGDGVVISGNNITQTTAASGSRGINLMSCDEPTVTGNLFRGMQNAIALSGVTRGAFSGNVFTGVTARAIWLAGTASTDCVLTANRSSITMVTEDVAPTRMLIDGLGTNGATDPASSGNWYSASPPQRWQGALVRWNSGGGEKVSIYN